MFLAEHKIKTQMFQCSNGLDAISTLNKQLNGSKKFDMIVVDLNIEGVDGWEVLARTDQRLIKENIKVVIFSSSTDSGDIKKARELSVPYFKKPEEPTDYKTIVNNIIGYMTSQN